MYPFPKKGDLGLAKNYITNKLDSIATKVYNSLLGMFFLLFYRDETQAM